MTDFSLVHSGDLFLLVGGGGDGAIRIHHGLGTAHHRHQQEETEEEEEEERKAEVHIYLELHRRARGLVHEANNDYWSLFVRSVGAAFRLSAGALQVLLVMNYCQTHKQIKTGGD